MARAFVSVGSNLDPETNVRRALTRLGGEVRIRGLSTFYATAPEGGRKQPPFYNGVVEIETEIPPRVLKYSVLRRIEEELGRHRTADKYAPRTIDLDLLLYDDVALESEDLVLPDPDIGRRPYLAIALAELAPDLALTRSGRRIEEIAAGMARSSLRPLVEYTARLRRDIEHGSREG